MTTGEDPFEKARQRAEKIDRLSADRLKSITNGEGVWVEREAERALHLGGPVPEHDEELKALHLKLNEAPLAYQRSGDPSVLIGIADPKVRYEERLREAKGHTEDAGPVNGVADLFLRDTKINSHEKKCMAPFVDFWITCLPHGWPRNREIWDSGRYVNRTLTARKADHIDHCTGVLGSLCAVHEWQIENQDVW